MDIKEELEIKQDSTKEYLGKLQYKVCLVVAATQLDASDTTSSA